VVDVFDTDELTRIVRAAAPFENEKRAKPALHVDAAAHAAVLAVSKGTPGIYNIVEDDSAVSNEKAKRELGFNAAFRVKL